MKKIEGKLSVLEKEDLKKTLLYLKQNIKIKVFTGISELSKIESEILRYFIVLICYDNFSGIDIKKNILMHVETYLKNYKKILYINKKYKLGENYLLLNHWYELENIFYYELYDIFIYHIDNFVLKNEFYGKFEVKGYPLELHIFKGKNDWHDSSNSLFLEILDNGVKMFGFSLYFGKNEIFIGNIQYTKEYYSKYRGMKKLRLHKYAFYYLKVLAEKFGKFKIISFSNENHCNGKLDHFNPIYNNLLEIIGMKKNDRGFYIGNIKELDIRYRNNKAFLNNIEQILKIIKLNEI